MLEALQQRVEVQAFGCRCDLRCASDGCPNIKLEVILAKNASSTA